MHGICEKGSSTHIQFYEAETISYHYTMLVLPADHYFNSIAFTNLKLQIVKVGKLDVCGRPLFASPITDVVYYDQLHCNGYLYSNITINKAAV